MDIINPLFVMIRFFFFITACCLSLNLTAQVSVYYFSGDVKYSAGKAEAKPVYFNAPVTASTLFTLASRSELILKDRVNNFLVIKEAGTYRAEDLLRLFLERNKTDFTSSALQFIANEFLHPHEDIKKYADKHLKQKGGVYRSGCVTPLMLFPALDETLRDTLIHFVWNRQPGATQYELRITDARFDPNNEQTYFRKIVSDTVFTLNASENTYLKKDSVFCWVVNPVNQPNCARYSFYFKPATRSEQVKRDLLKSIPAGLNFEESILAICVVFEREGLIREAEQGYLFLYESTENKGYLNMLALFRARHGLIKPE
jgi:hypothetical protein